jgi:hypothetical protein
MAAVKKSEVVPATPRALVPAPTPAAPPLREAADGDFGAPNPALLAQRDRIIALVSEAPEPHAERYAPRVRLAIMTAAITIPWVAIWFVLKGIFPRL